jgi:nucleoside-diphosphate-sugar epimerase
MKILVTGANGYLGKGIVKCLLDDGIEVVATDTRDDLIDKRAEIKVVDLFSLDTPYEYFGSPDVLLHMAWRDGFVHGSINHINDLPRHYAFIKKMAEGGVEKISVMGSMHEVGFFEGSINENTPTNPESLYGISKNTLRDLVRLICKERNISYQWMRGFYIVGNTTDGSSVFSKIIQQANAGKTEFPFTLGLNQFDFIDYDRFCRYVADTVEQNEINGIINICSGRPEKLADRVEQFIDENRLNIKLQYGVFPDRPYDSKAIWGDDSKIRRIEERKTYE